MSRARRRTDRRECLAAAIERLVNLLDVIDEDPDLKPKTDCWAGEDEGMLGAVRHLGMVGCPVFQGF